MEFAGSSGAELPCHIRLRKDAKSLGNSGWVEARQREMWREFPRFTRNSQFCESRVNFGGKRRQVRRCFNSCPKNPWTFSVWKESQSTESHLNWAFQANFRKRGANRIELAVVNMSDKFQCNVQIFRSHPARSILGKRGVCRA